MGTAQQRLAFVLSVAFYAAVRISFVVSLRTDSHCTAAAWHISRSASQRRNVSVAHLKRGSLNMRHMDYIGVFLGSRWHFLWRCSRARH